jgi:hypothetical protein
MGTLLQQRITSGGRRGRISRATTAGRPSAIRAPREDASSRLRSQRTRAQARYAEAQAAVWLRELGSGGAHGVQPCAGH